MNDPTENVYLKEKRKQFLLSTLLALISDLVKALMKKFSR